MGRTNDEAHQDLLALGDEVLATTNAIDAYLAQPNQFLVNGKHLPSPAGAKSPVDHSTILRGISITLLDSNRTNRVMRMLSGRRLSRVVAFYEWGPYKW